MQRRHWHETTCSKLPWSRSVLPPIEGETRPTIDMAQFRQRFANSAVAVVGDATAEVLYIALVQQLCTSPNVAVSVLVRARGGSGNSVWFRDANMTLRWHDAPYLIPAVYKKAQGGTHVFINEHSAEPLMAFEPQDFSNVHLVLVAIGRAFSPRVVPRPLLVFKRTMGTIGSQLQTAMAADSQFVRHCVQTRT